MIKAIIIDDEHSGRNALKSLLADYDDQLRVVALCSNADEATEAIHIHQPNVIFLDIEMPDKTGFELLDELPDINFEIIFVTAFNQYALEAIKHAFDYLLKPIDPDELEQTVLKLIKKIGDAQTKEGVYEKLKSLLYQVQPSLANNNRLALSTAEGVYIININDVIKVTSDGKYSIFQTVKKEKIMTSKHLGMFEAKLESMGLIRIQRSCIINPEHIKKYIKGGIAGTVVMSDESEIEVSKLKKEELLQRIGMVDL